MIMRPLLAILVLLAAIPLAYAGGKKPPQTPGTRTREFLDVYGHEAAPQEIKRIDKMRIILSKQLYAALRATRLEQETPVAADQPGDKPGQIKAAPIEAGSVEIGFHSGETSAFESYDIRTTNLLAKNRAAVDVEFVANTENTPVRWRDRYEWVREGSMWKLDDIVYRSTGRPGPRDRRLTKLLGISPAPAERLFPERPPVKAGQSR
jgi:hypothetical protein